MEPLELLASKVGTSDGQGRAREGEREVFCFVLRTWQRPFLLVLALNIAGGEVACQQAGLVDILIFNKRESGRYVPGSHFFQEMYLHTKKGFISEHKS